MPKTNKSLVIPGEVILNKIYFMRGQKVMLDRDLANLYGVTTGNLNKAVSRDIDRFPDDFMFALTKEEMNSLIFQNGISSWGGTRKLPRAFTEQGVAMLSGVLNSETAVRMLANTPEQNWFQKKGRQGKRTDLIKNYFRGGHNL